MQEFEAKSLLSKYQAGTCTAEEKAMVENWLTFGNATNLNLSEQELDADLIEIRNRLAVTKVKKVKLWYRYTAAAVILIAFGTYFYTTNPTTRNLQLATDINPGTNGATLTLADGRKIRLTDASNGELAEEAGVKISKTASGELIYKVLSQESSVGSLVSGTNTLETQRGETYSVILPDGSKVWLNAASSLKYPANFASLKERRVELVGEAYFEVAKAWSLESGVRSLEFGVWSKEQGSRSKEQGSKSKDEGSESLRKIASLRARNEAKQSPSRIPFFVKTATQQVEVLGTHFNINAYADEPMIKTTLLEGSVKVSHLTSHISHLLKPNQESSFIKNEFKVEDVDAQEAILWKTGKFAFNSEELGSIMRKVARWYNVEIEFADNLQREKLSGSVSRFANLSTLLHKLEETGGMHFEIVQKGNTNKIIITN